MWSPAVIALYTLTYTWPNIPLNPPRHCDQVPGFFNRHILNDRLKTARYVGPEVLQGKAGRRVDHWRVGVVGGSTVPGEFFRFPIALGDIYVDQRDPGQWWQVLQFGQVTLPERCL